MQFAFTDRWQFFEIPTFAIGYRYVRLFFENGFTVGYNYKISEVEFFQYNSGKRADTSPKFPICLPPGGTLTYDGTRFTCTCGFGYSGAVCEQSPSLSRIEPLIVEKLYGAKAVDDSGSIDSESDFTKASDGTLETGWDPRWDVSGDVYIVFDMLFPSHVTGFATCGRRYAFSTLIFEYGPSHSGPWSVAFETTNMYDRWEWQYFSVTMPEPMQYIRLKVSGLGVFHHPSHYGGLLEVEFFKPSSQLRIV